MAFPNDAQYAIEFQVETGAFGRVGSTRPRWVRRRQRCPDQGVIQQLARQLVRRRDSPASAGVLFVLQLDGLPAGVPVHQCAQLVETPDQPDGDVVERVDGAHASDAEAHERCFTAGSRQVRDAAGGPDVV